jgi:hypothetical protein
VSSRPVWRTRLVTLAIVLGCVVLATVGIRFTDRQEGFQVVRAKLGSTVSINEGEVSVDNVRVGDRLFEDGAVTDRTPGMFVVVQVTAAATGSESLVLSESQLLSGDRVYKVYSALSNITVVPGFQTKQDLVYEVDPHRIDGLTVELWRLEVVSGYHQRVRVPLGISSRNADDWRAEGHRLIGEPDTAGTTRVIP